MRTWQNLATVVQDCPFPWNDELSMFLRQLPSVANVNAVVTLLTEAMEFLQQQQRQQRLKLWKRQMRGSASKASLWRKTRQRLTDVPNLQHYTCVAMKLNGHLTINRHRQLQAVLEA